MKKLASALTVGALAVITGGVLIAGAGSASAQGTPPPWAPGGVNQDPLAVGGLEFFDAAGNQITSGPIGTAPFAKYAVGLSKTRTVAWTDTTATLFGYLPQFGLTPDNWHTNEQIGLSTTFPNAAAPAPINSTALPVNTGGTTDTDLGTLASDLGATSTQSGYSNVYEIRLYTGAAGHPGSTTYDYADITIDSSSNTWSLVYSPDQASTATSSVLSSSATSINQGDSVTLTDTITPAGATGTVQFKDGSGNIGSPVTVTGGVATTTAQILTSGSHSITAVYTPTALSGFGGSTSNAVPITAAVVATNTTTAVSHAFAAYTPNPDSSVPAFTPTTLTASVTPSGVAGTVQFFDNAAAIGSPKTVTAGVATLANYANFAQGNHSVTATFTPTDTTSFHPSTSAADAFALGAPAGAAPDQQNISVDVPNGSLAITSPYTASNPLDLGPLALNAAGTELSGTADFGSATGTSADPLANTIKVVDTRTGGQNWAVSALSTALDAGVPAGDISAENVGLTNLVAVPLAGNHLSAANTATHDNAAADPAVALSDPGTLGLGGTTPHAIANSTDPVNGGTGTIGFVGKLTVTAPTSTQPGHYTGTVTFTVV